MGMEDLLIDITYDPCKFSLDSTFKDGPSSPHPLPIGRLVLPPCSTV
jgi:hypothetical protein